MPHHSFKRADRLNEALRENIGLMLLRTIKAPDLSGVAVVRVDAAPDLNQAVVYYRHMGLRPDQERDIEAMTETLTRAGGKLRHELGKVLRLKRVPQLKFVYDSSLEEQVRLHELLQQVKSESNEPEDENGSPDAHL